MPLFCAWWCFFTHEVAGDIFSMSQEANEYFKWSQRSWQRLTKHHRNMIIEGNERWMISKPASRNKVNMVLGQNLEKGKNRLFWQWKWLQMSGSMHSKIRPRLIQYLSSPKRKTEMNQQWIARRSTSDRRKSFWREAAILLVVKTLFEKDKRRFLNFFRSRTSRGRKFKLKSPRFYKSKFATIFRKHSFSVMAIFFLSMTKG